MNWITPYFSKLFLVKILSSRKGYWCVTRDGTETCPASPRACPCPLGHCHLCPPRLHLLGKSKFWPLFFSRRFYSYWIQPTISSPHPWQWRATDTVSRVISVHHPWRAGHVCFSPVNAEPAPALARTLTGLWCFLLFPPSSEDPCGYDSSSERFVLGDQWLHFHLFSPHFPPEPKHPFHSLSTAHQKEGPVFRIDSPQPSPHFPKETPYIFSS